MPGNPNGVAAAHGACKAVRFMPTQRFLNFKIPEKTALETIEGNELVAISHHCGRALIIGETLFVV